MACLASFSCSQPHEQVGALRQEAPRCALGECFCGDEECNLDETFETCPKDCPAPPETCGNGLCRGAETCSSCSTDCGKCPAKCGDGSCNGSETCSTCSTDCGKCPAKCGDGACNGSETCSTCSKDCGACPPKCGDGTCNGSETCATCPADCAPPEATCGNGSCDCSETKASCAVDCDPCGNGACESGETALSCPFDCGPTSDPPPKRLQPSTPGTGTMHGSSSVTRVGAYEYDLPLEVPAGRAGMAPELGLHYNSNGGEGHLGVGWSLKGSSQIRRCRETWARDGRAEKIDFDALTFCLDGEPLIVKSRSGATVEYRTAQDRFARIISAGGATPNKPARFHVYQRDGRIYEYGNTSDSAPKVGTTTGVVVPAERLVWALSAIVDRSGNSIELSYGGPSGDFERYLVDIKYTGSRNAQNKYVGPLRRVHFEYEQRPVPIVRYIDHRPESSSVRLTKITSYLKPSASAAEDIVYSYELDYGAAPSEETHRSLLRSVTWCDGIGACLMPTTFKYSEAALDQPYALAYSAPLSDRPDKTVWTRLLVTDLNGDGGDDVIYTLVHPDGKSPVGTDTDSGRAHRRVFAMLAAGCGFEDAIDISKAFASLPLNDPWAFVDPFRSRPADFDGDGKSELMVWGAHREGMRYGHRIYGWDSATNTLVPKQAFNHNPPPGIVSYQQGTSMTLDLNGDGALDFVASDGTGPYYYRLGTAGSLTLGEASVLGSPKRTGGCSLPPWSMDLDSDGRAELVEGCEDSGYIKSYGLDKTGAPETTSRADQHGLLPGFGKWDVVLVDVNGDGLKDALYYATQGQRFEIRVNTGQAFLPPYEAAPELSGVGRDFEADHVRVADFNGDGLEDLMLLEAGAHDDIEDSSLINRYTEAPEILFSDGFSFWRAPEHILGAETMPRLKHGRDNLPNSAGWSSTQLADVDGDGVPELLTIDKSEGKWRLNTYSRRVALGPSPAAGRDRLVEVTPGQGLTEHIEYEPILGGDLLGRDFDIYQPATTCQAPEYCVKRGFVVVDELKRAIPGDDTSAGLQVLQYSYKDGRAHTRGYGFLGFGKVTEREPAKNRETITTYNISPHSSGAFEIYPALGVPRAVEEKQWYINSAGISTSRRTTRLRTYTSQLIAMDGPGSPFSSQGYFRAVSNLSSVQETVSEGANTGAALPILLSKRTDLTNYDSYGNWQTRTTLNEGGEGTAIVRTLDNDPANWLIGQVRTETVTSAAAAPSTETATHTTHYDYWPTTGLLKSRIIEPNDKTGAEKLAITHRWKSGLLVGLNQTNNAGEWRPRAYHYDTEGVFPIAIVTELGYTTRLSWYRGIGKMESAAAPDLVKDGWEYDGFGRLTAELPAGAAATRVDYAASSAPSVTVNGVKTRLTDEITTTVDSTTQVARTFLDSAGRPVLQRWLDFAGVEAQQFRRFDVYGRPVAKTNAVKAPAQAKDGSIAASSAPKSSFTFDVLDRLTTLTLPDETTKTISYPSLFTRTERDAKLDATTTTYNPDGRVKEVVTGASALVRTYGPFGRVMRESYGTSATNGKKTDRLYSYDQRERLRSSSEFELQRSYNAFDELVREERGEVQTTFQYDKMGRVLEMEGTNEDGAKDFTEFVYDEGPHALGKLSSAFSGPAFALDAGNEAPVSSSSSFGYDEFGRLKQKKIATEYGEDALDFTYDAAGRVETVLYPHQGPAAARFGIKYGYNAVGYLQRIENSATSALYWRVTARTPDGLLSEEKFGNAVVRTHEYDPNMRWLKSLNAKRLTTVLQDLTYTYHADGNLATRSDNVTSVMDTFGYDSDDRLTRWTRSGAASLDRVYAYNPDGGMKSVTNDYFSDGSQTAVRNFQYSVTVDPKTGLMATPTLRTDGEFDYRYDKSGRQTIRTTKTSAVSRRIDYTSFDLPKRIESGGVVTTYSYDAFQQRLLKRTATSVTRYFDDLYERRSDVNESPGSVVNVYRVMGEGGQVAQVTRAGDDTTQPASLYYFHNDAVGSVSVVASSTGVVSQRLEYEPFGRRISTNGKPTLPSASSVKVGFTGHEHDDEHGLISMRGRMYDPSIRRFVTPDPVVQDPLNPQSYNPFTYVLNNPLKLIDPTGFWGIASGTGSEGDPETTDPIDGEPEPRVRAGGGMEEPANITPERLAGGSEGRATGADFVGGGSDGTHDSGPGPAPPSPGASQDDAQKSLLDEIGQGAIDVFVREPVCAVFGCGPAVGSVGGGTRQLSETEKVLQTLAYFGTGAIVGAVMKRTATAVGKRAAAKLAAKLAQKALGKAKNIALALPGELKVFGKCADFAQALQEGLAKAGVKGTRIEISVGKNVTPYSDKLGALAERGHGHSAIRVGDMVFDNLRPGGIPYADFVADLGGSQFFGTPFVGVIETAF